MNSEQRAALIEELTQAQHDAWPGVDADFIVNTEAIMPIIDRLLTTRAAPEPDEGAVERAAKAIDEFVRNQIASFGVADMPISDFWKGQSVDLAECALQAAARKGAQE